MKQFEPMQNKNWNQSPPPDDDGDDMRSIMLERLSIVVARGGSEMEEKLKYIYRGGNLRSCRFLWSSDPDHQLFKQKVAEYIKSPPPPTPRAARNVQRVDPRDKLGNFGEQLALRSELCVFYVGIPPGMMRKELDIMKFTVQFVVRYGRDFRLALWERVSTDTQFNFLKFMDKREPRDMRYYLFYGLLRGYLQVMRAWETLPTGMEAVLEGFFTALNAFKKKQEGEEKDEVVDKVETDRRDFLVCDEYFVDIEKQDFLPEPSPFIVRIPQGGMMCNKELGIIKFTAQFVVRYGDEFWGGLWDKVCTKTEFRFLKRNPGNDTFFSQLLLAYGNVIQPWEIQPRKSDTARMEAVLERVFAAFCAFKEKQEEEGDEVVGKSVTDRRDFLVSDEYFLDIEEFTRPEMVSPSSSPKKVMMMQPQPVHEEPKLDESDLVSEEEFLAQHPGSSTITIYVTSGRAIQITVESLSENVGSLKKKIAGEIGIPAKRQKLMGKTGFLKDDMSLAHYNLGVGEMLTLVAY